MMSQDTIFGLQEDKKYRYSLAVIAAKATLLKPIRLNPVPYIPSNTDTLFQYDQLPGMWTALSLVLSMVNTVAFIILYRKFKLIAFALSSRPIASLMRQATSVEAIYLDWTDTTTTAQTATYQNYLAIF
jgi:hypothetical protein